MDSMVAMIRGEIARAEGEPLMVFDWEKAARLIRERKPAEASAGLRGDWGYTGGVIYRDGAVVTDDYTYLASIWAKPELDMDGDIVPCWRLASDSPGWDAETKWPESATVILAGDRAEPR